MMCKKIIITLPRCLKCIGLLRWFGQHTFQVYFLADSITLKSHISRTRLGYKEPELDDEEIMQFESRNTANSERLPVTGGKYTPVEN
jgi:hypothetical protein